MEARPAVDPVGDGQPGRPGRPGRRRSARSAGFVPGLLPGVALLLWLLWALPPLCMASGASAPRIEEQSARPHFPDTIEFTLRVRELGFEAQRAVLNYRLVGEPVTAQAEADLKQASADVDVSLSLDLSTHYMPPGSGVTYYWTLVGEADQQIDTPAGSFTLLDERHDWQSLSDDRSRVTVHWYEGSEQFGRRLLDTATGALDRLERATGEGLQRPANIWVYASQDELIDALPKNIPEWVGGKAFPELALVLTAIADDSIAEEEIKRIIPHELSHLLLYQATRNPYNTPPAWLDEGLATYNQQVQDPSEEDMLRQAVEEGGLIPLRALSGSFGADEEEAVLSYAESRSVVEFIMTDSRYGPDRLARTIAAFRQGVTYDEALQAGLGVTVDELDRQWREWLPTRVGAQSAGQGDDSTPGQATEPGNRPKGGQPSGLLRPGSVLLIVAGIWAGLFVVGALVTLGIVLRRRHGHSARAHHLLAMHQGEKPPPTRLPPGGS